MIRMTPNVCQVEDVIAQASSLLMDIMAHGNEVRLISNHRKIKGWHRDVPHERGADPRFPHAPPYIDLSRGKSDVDRLLNSWGGNASCTANGYQVGGFQQEHYLWIVRA